MSDIEQLLQQEVDGANSPEDSARIQALIAADPDVRRSFDDLKILCSTLEDRRAEAVPAGFTERVMAALPAPQLARPVHTPSVRPSILQRLFSPRRRLAWALSAVAVLVTATAVLMQVPVDSGSAAGTLVDPQVFELEGAVLELRAGELQAQVDETATVRLSAEGDLLIDGVTDILVSEETALALKGRGTLLAWVSVNGTPRDSVRIAVN